MTISRELIRDAVVTLWLRNGYGASATEIATQLEVPASKVRAAIKDGGEGRQARSLDEAQLPGCKTIAGGSLGRGMGTLPTRWEPHMAHLRALIRGEGTGQHCWSVAAMCVFKGTPWVSGGGRHTFDVEAPTEREAVEATKAAACAYYKQPREQLHSNSTFTVVWRGKKE